MNGDEVPGRVTIAFIGLSKMGAAMTANIRRAGHCGLEPFS
jgi:hypothetical protein